VHEQVGDSMLVPATSGPLCASIHLSPVEEATAEFLKLPCHIAGRLLPQCG
jgi:hypothetical protein